MIDIKLNYRKKTKPHVDVQYIHQQQQENSLSGIHIPRDVSAPDLLQMKQSAQKSPSLSPSPIGSPTNSPARGRRNIMSDLKKNINTGLKNISKLNLPGIKISRTDIKSIGDTASVVYTSDKSGLQFGSHDSLQNVSLPVTLGLEHREGSEAKV